LADMVVELGKIKHGFGEGVQPIKGNRLLKGTSGSFFGRCVDA